MDDLVERALALVDPRARSLLGVVGAPGAGKSTIAAALVERLSTEGVTAALVPMDGFHLPQAELVRRGIRDVMGRIDTFDAEGYLALLRRLLDETDREVTAPGFDRSVEEPVADAVLVGPEVELVVTEGNYLLDDEPPWPEIRETLTEVWYVESDEEARLERLLARHVAFGKTEEEARSWMARVDEPNAVRIAARRGEADLVVDLR
jgi:pantothenate kinase